METKFLPAGQFSQQYNKHACYHMDLQGKCKKTGEVCIFWKTLDDCDDYVLNTSAVRRSAIEKELLTLIDEAAGNMVFVEHEDGRFSNADIRRFRDCVDRNNLHPYIIINEDKREDALITIYPGIRKILV